MKITAEKRTQTGTSASRKARAEGKVPAAIYGKDVDSVSVLINQKELENTLREVGSNGVFDVEVDGETYHVFVKETFNSALKPITYQVDLLAFTAGQKVQMSIPVYVHGEEEIKEGNINQSISEIDLEIAPSKAPSEIIVNVSDLTVGDSLSVADLDLPEDADILTDADSTVVSVSAPDEFVEPETDEAAEEMPEPEVIGESDEEAEEE
jgi:large subunit ribosomal protein L25